MSVFNIREDDLSGKAVRELLELHVAGMHADSPPGHSFALDLRGLQAPNVTVWSAWKDKALAGVAAMVELENNGGEIKSMRTAPSFLRQGVAAALLEHIISEARRRGLQKLSLETGAGPAFEPAIGLYRRYGFVPGESFADYVRSEFNQFFHLSLA